MKLTASVFVLTSLSLQSAYGGLILGWHDFNQADVPASNTPDLPVGYPTGSFLGGLNPIGATYLAGSGSSDGTYGDLVGFIPAPGPATNGSIDLDSKQEIELWVTNVSSSTYIFDNLYFDWAKGSGADTREVSVSFTDADELTTPIGSYISSSTTGVWTSFGEDLTALNFFVAPSATVIFTFTNSEITNNGRLDNIAVSAFSAIPEVSSALVLGALLSSGFLVRRRPTTATKRPVS
ncbi:MAG: hypothetical protein ACKV19_25920 [Verrucomicrobiales bacterium]